jgi:hypothetical protein
MEFKSPIAYSPKSTGKYDSVGLFIVTFYSRQTIVCWSFSTGTSRPRSRDEKMGGLSDGVKGKTEDLTNQNLTNSFSVPLLLRLSTTVRISWAAADFSWGGGP